MEVRKVRLLLYIYIFTKCYFVIFIIKQDPIKQQLTSHSRTTQTEGRNTQEKE